MGNKTHIFKPNPPDPEHGSAMVGIFWLIETAGGITHLLSEGVTLAQAEAYGDFLTFGPGHYDVWNGWRRRNTLGRDVSVLIRTDEYEDWPRGRVVFDGPKNQFVIYADRKLLTPTRIADICSRFHLGRMPFESRTDAHYRSRFSPS